MEIFPIAEVRTRLESHDGGWEVVHESPNLEVGVLVRIAPTPDPPVRHTADEVYVVLAGEATLEAEGESRRLKPGDTAFVAVGKEHHFVDYAAMRVLAPGRRAALIFGPHESLADFELHLSYEDPTARPHRLTAGWRLEHRSYIEGETPRRTRVVHGPAVADSPY